MSWLVTMLMSGVLLSIGWKIGGLIYEWIYDFIVEAPDGIRRIRRYQNRRKNPKYIAMKRSRKES